MLPKNNYNGFYCPSLYKSVFIDTGGQISPCCVFKYYENPEDNKLAHEPNIENLHNSEIFTKNRNTISQGKIPKACRFCVSQETKSKKHSERLDNISRFGAVDKTHLLEGNTVSSDSIEYVDLRLGNICNMMCKYCGPKNSHLLAKEAGAEQHRLHKDWHDAEYKKQVLAKLNQYKNLHRISIAGGEPFFMAKEFMNVLDALEKRKEDIEIKITTNGSLYPEQIIERLKGFKQINLLISLDSIGRTLEIARWKSHWKTIEENIKKFKSLDKRNWKIRLVPLVSAYTVLDFPKLLNWAIQNNIELASSWIQDPQYQKISMIYSDNLQKVFDECKQIQLANPDTTNIWSWNSIFGNLHYYIKRNQVTGEVIKDFWNRQTYFEKNRNYRLQHELPHVYDGLKKC
jgi:sulfatase maturation enzyme AslB (radical SAM superfamily)